MGWFSQKSNFQWKELSNENSIHQLLDESQERPILIFKHSTRCSISSMALSRFERDWDCNKDVGLYFLDLLNFRNLSNVIADTLKVIHQSPQVIVIKKSEVVYQESHNGIDAREIAKLI
ncbi:MAG: bacillithiol system redox-active protein YtxJ [Bacteroidetes bacterium]|nr:bacillithiol system redox-active protein YtxJ [Bacteroidota bacterium]